MGIGGAFKGMKNRERRGSEVGLRARPLISPADYTYKQKEPPRPGLGGFSLWASFF
jgi:hypothetical protein